MNKRVLFQANWCPQYRYPFYDGLRTELEDRGIDLELSYGSAPRKFRARGDHAPLGWARRRRQWMPGRGNVELQFDPIHVRKSHDLVVIEIIAKQVSTYAQIGLHRLGVGPPIAFFGHGAVDRTPSTSVAQRVKRLLASSGAGWLVYTDQGADALVDYGVRRDDVHVINNTIDASGLRRGYLAAKDRAAEIRQEYGVGDGPVLLHIGGLDASKRLDLVIEAFGLIQREHPNATLIVAGAGSGAGEVRSAAEQNSAIVYVGPVFGDARSELFAISDLLLHPGKVGLVVIDSFATGVPLVVAGGQLQAPEFDYLNPTTSLFAAETEPASVAAAALEVLGDPVRKESLSTHSWDEYSRYDMQGMVKRAADGIESLIASTSGGA